jgi:hypothetical protein
MFGKLNDHYFPLIEFLTVVESGVFPSSQADDGDAVFQGPDRDKITTDNIQWLKRTWSQGLTP